MRLQFSLQCTAPRHAAFSQGQGCLGSLENGACRQAHMLILFGVVVMQFQGEQNWGEKEVRPKRREVTMRRCVAQLVAASRGSMAGWPGGISGEAILNHCCLEAAAAGDQGTRGRGGQAAGSFLCFYWAKITRSSSMVVSSRG